MKGCAGDLTFGRAGPQNVVTASTGRHRASIALFGLFGVGNLGNDGSLAAMVSSLRRAMPDSRITCFCPRPDLISARFGIDAAPFRSDARGGRWRFLTPVTGRLADFRAAVASLRDKDILIVPGTGILDDFGERPQGMPLEIFKWCLAAKLAGTPVAFVGIGAGPIRHPVSRWLMVRAARLAAYRSYRDLVSRDFMAHVGVDTRADPVCPDLAFGLGAPRSSSASTGGEPLSVGVGVMFYHGWYRWMPAGGGIYEAYLSRLGAFVLWLLDRGHRVRLLIGQESDHEAIADLLKRLEAMRRGFPRRKIVAAGAASLEELMAQIGQTDLVVATRFHNVVCALKMARPTISLGYARKNEVLLEDMGLVGFSQHVEEFDLDKLKAQFLRLEAERDALANSIRDRVAGYEKALTRQDEKLAALLAGSKSERRVAG